MVLELILIFKKGLSAAELPNEQALQAWYAGKTKNKPVAEVSFQLLKRIQENKY